MLGNQTATQAGRGGSHQQQTACPLSLLRHPHVPLAAVFSFFFNLALSLSPSLPAPPLSPPALRFESGWSRQCHKDYTSPRCNAGTAFKTLHHSRFQTLSGAFSHLADAFIQSGLDIRKTIQALSQNRPQCNEYSKLFRSSLQHQITLYLLLSATRYFSRTFLLLHCDGLST